LVKLARARAVVQGRDYVLPDDIKALAVPALAHRLILSPDLWAKRITAQDIVTGVVSIVPVPKVP
jgi:MoxR-like ATPase